jgi:alpha-tubulin suppressor-like RCC1 family protein
MVRNIRKERFTGAAHHHPFYLGFLLIFLFTTLAPAVSMAATPQVSAGKADLLAFQDQTHSVALKSDGTVWTWGDNSLDQLGLGLGAAANSPYAQQVSGISGVIAVAAGADHTLALDSSGNVWAWGSKDQNQLGDTAISNNAIPTNISTNTAGFPKIVAIAAGVQFSMALDSSGAVWVWGRNDFGQLGTGFLGDGTNIAGTVQTPTKITTLSGVKWIAAGNYHAIATNGTTVWAWGSNSNGQLGNGTTADSTSPVPVTNLSGVTNIAAGAYHSLALTSGGAVVAWGKNAAGQLGNNSNTDSDAPVAVSNLSGVTGIAAGADHSLAVDSNGNVWAWGDNSSGQFGNGDATDTTGSLVPLNTFSAASPADGCSAGVYFTLILKDDGTVWASGINDSGQLGNKVVDDNGISSTNATPASVQILSSTSGFESLPLAVLGDMNSDGKVAAVDALLALQYAVGINTLNLTKFDALARGDMNGDGKINAVDALLILQKAVGL